MATITAAPAKPETMELAPKFSGADKESEAGNPPAVGEVNLDPMAAQPSIAEKVSEKISGVGDAISERIAGLGNRLRQMEPIQAAATVATVLTIGGGVAKMAIDPPTALGAPNTPGKAPKANANPSATSSEATATASTWTNLGGDPLFSASSKPSFPNGLQTERDFVRAITSDRGKAALDLMGLDGRERRAILHAARVGDARSCTVRFGERFKKMTYGVNGPSLEKDVAFADPDYPNGTDAWCLNAVIRGKNGKKEIIKLKTPVICGNIALKKVVHRKPQERRPRAPVRIVKKVKDSSGNKMNPTPTGTFRFRGVCFRGNQKIVSTAIYNRPGQVILRGCDVGRPSKVKELTPKAGGWKVWKPETPKVQRQVVRKRGNRFVFLNRQRGVKNVPANVCVGDTTNVGVNNGIGGQAQGGNCSVNINCSAINSPSAEVCSPEVPPSKPPEEEVPQNNPPTGTMDLHQRIAGTTDKVCADDLHDSDGDSVQVTDFTFTNANGNSVGKEKGPIYSLDSDTQCQDYEAPTTPQEVNVHAFLTDSRGAKTTLFNTMPVTPDQF
ncbi:MAG TPA: hypothetical protein VFX86_04505 [Candidatus Saccharimonadales bacterium]|nr:hypothetical protein [Candidatus Saccharimonadales bacterium]